MTACGRCCNRYDCYHGVELQPHSGPPPPPPVGFAKFDGYNCYSGHGADDIDVNAVKDLSVSQCEARCDADSSSLHPLHHYHPLLSSM